MMRRVIQLISLAACPIVFAVGTTSAAAAGSTSSAPDPAGIAKEIADAANTNADTANTENQMEDQKVKLEAETAQLIAEAQELAAKADLEEAQAAQIYAEIDALQQRMRISEYEFDRIVKADYQMDQDIQIVQNNQNLVHPLAIGVANWKTWSALDFLMMTTGDAAIISQVMFDIPVPPFPASEFRPNMGGEAPAFPGGNLGQLYNFAEENDLSFRKFGPAHEAIMKVLAMINTATDLRIRELRDINQEIRLTIAKITNT